jgi:cytochrome c-type biogenesis protein CcmH/NrfF
MRRAWGLLGLLVAVLVIAGPASAAARLNYPTIEDQYMCVSCNLPLPEAESDQASREKALIRRLIAQGDTAAQVKTAMVAVYTDKVLQLPPQSGFNLVAYIVPIAAVILLVGLLLAVLPRWRRRSVAVAAPVALGDADNVRLDADLARFD